MIGKLLTAAGRAAAFMPKLEVLEIWNATFTYGAKDPANRWEGAACIFQYVYSSKKPKIIPLQATGSGRTCRTRWGIVWNTAGRIYTLSSGAIVGIAVGSVVMGILLVV